MLISWNGSDLTLEVISSFFGCCVPFALFAVPIVQPVMQFF